MLRAVPFKYTWDGEEQHLFQTAPTPPPPIEKKTPPNIKKYGFTPPAPPNQQKNKKNSIPPSQPLAEQQNSFIVFGLTQTGLEPMVYCTWGERANHYIINVVYLKMLI